MEKKKNKKGEPIRYLRGLFRIPQLCKMPSATEQVNKQATCSLSQSFIHPRRGSVVSLSQHTVHKIMYEGESGELLATTITHDVDLMDVSWKMALLSLTCV